MNPQKLDIFERAFSNSTAGCRRTCECGRIFYDGAQSYDWEEGELEALKNDPKATFLEYAPGDIGFEGSQYVDACNCWHERAERIMRFIDSHAHKIARYLNLEKERKQREANESPTVNPP